MASSFRPTCRTIDFDTNHWWFNGESQSGFSITISGGIAYFNFTGDLKVNTGVTIKATGANGLSFQVANDVNIEDGVKFDLSADHQTAGAGGGTAGGQGGGGGGGSGGSLAEGGTNGSIGPDGTSNLNSAGNWSGSYTSMP